MDLQLQGKVALVTGASRGLGRAIARTLGEEGCRLSICARGAQMLTATASELQAAGLEVLPEVVDVTDPARAKAWIDHVLDRYRTIDVLVNNAGAARPGALAELPDTAWREAFDLNLFAPVMLSRLCAAKMTERGGAIVNIASIYGREAGGPLTYNASKAALISFTKMLARELAPRNVRVNAIAPGSILYRGGSWERRFKENPAFERDFISHELPGGRLGHPEEVAYAVAVLASPKASWITGACLPVDGAQGRSLI